MLNNYSYVDNLEIVKSVSTPITIFNRKRIANNVIKVKKEINNMLKKSNYNNKFKYAYATKANYLKCVIDEVVKYVDCLEFSSEVDLKIAEYLYNNRKIDNKYEIICNGIKTKKYIEEIIRLKKKGLNIIPIIDNQDELNVFLKYLKYDDVTINIGIRVNVDYIYIKRKSRFGIPVNELDNILNTIRNKDNISLKILHFHTDYSNNIDEYCSLIYNYFEIYLKIVKKSNSLNTIDIGGGLPVENFSISDLNKLEKTIKEINKKFYFNNINQPSIIIEYGKYTVSNAFDNIYKVISKKVINGDYYYVLDSSIMNFLPDVWGINKKFKFIPLNYRYKEYKKVYLCGLTCDPDDIYGPVDMPLIDDNEELYISALNIGAYQQMISGYKGAHHCLIKENKVTNY